MATTSTMMMMTVRIDGKTLETQPATNGCDGCACDGNNLCAKMSPCANIIWVRKADDNSEEVGSVGNQVGGSHYLKAIQPWDIIRAWALGFHRGNIVKYVLRAPLKNGREDLEKARHYLDYLIENYDELKKEGIL